VPETFLCRLKLPPKLLAAALELMLAACQTTDDGSAANAWMRPPLRGGDDGKSAAARAPGGPLPATRDEPATGRSLVHRGTGNLIGAGSSRTIGAIPADEDGVTVNLANASIAQAAKTILGDILGVNYSVNAKLEGKVTIQTSTPVSHADLVDLFQSALRANGAVVVKNGAIYQIEPADQAAKTTTDISVGMDANPGGLVGVATRIVQLKYVAAPEMRRILEPMVQKGVILRADDARNTLTLSGTRSDVGAMLDAISVFDVDVMRGMSVAVVPVRAAQPDAIADDLRAIFGTDREGPMSGMVRFIPNQRLKSILVISPQQNYLSRAERLIRDLDAKVQGPDKQLFTYSPRNRAAKELVGIVESIFSPSARNAAQNGRNVAPRYQETTVQSVQAAGGAAPSSGLLAAAGGGAALGGGPSAAQAPSSAAAGSATQSDTTPSNTAISGPSGEDERVRLSVDEPNNTLIVLASRADYQRVLRILQNLDVVPNQVLIEATIAEVSLTDDLKFGVRWHFDGKKAGYSLTDLASGAFGSAFPGFSYAVAAANVQVTLNALNEITQVNVISSPSLTVVNNRTATLQIGDQVPVVTQSAVGVVGTGAPIVNSVNYRDTGVILSITPHINESGRVLLSIEQEVSSVAATTTSSIDSPTIKQRRVKTTVLVNDGEALALGGLIQDQISDTRTQLPILGDIPLIGNAFRQKGGNIGKTELVVFITPRVVRNLNEARDITDEYRRKFDVYIPHTRGARRPVERTLRRALE